MPTDKKTPWYAAGLCFECVQCGECCSGPGEGYIWVTRAEIELLADFLDETIGHVRRTFLKRMGVRTTIIEHQLTRDCIFLRKIDGQKKCVIYPVRPNQCRTWPFWTENLKSPKTWNETLQKCGGINRGRLYSLAEIEKIRKSKKWWIDPKQTAKRSKE